MKNVIVWVLCLSALFGIMYIQNQAFTPPLPEKIGEGSSIHYKFKGFNSITPTKNDPTVELTKQFLGAYIDWTVQHPDLDDAVETFVALHNKYVPKYKDVGITIPAIKDEYEYLAKIQPLINDLQKKGWYFSVAVPTPIALGDGHTNYGALPVLGEIYAHRSGTVFDERKKRKIPFQEQIVFHALTLQTQGNVLAANTDNSGLITHYFEPLARYADIARDACVNPKGDNNAVFYYTQWGSICDKKDSPKEFDTPVISGVLASTSQHEQQHVKDIELRQSLKGGIESADAQKRYLLLEARGLLASIAYGPIPYYSVGHMANASQSVNPLRKAYGTVAMMYFRNAREAEMKKDDMMAIALHAIKDSDVDYEKMFPSK